MWIANNWQEQEYELIDATDGERLEKWGKYLLVRPDPQVIWKGEKTSSLWSKFDAIYHRSSTGGGGWNKNKLPQEWNVQYNPLNLNFQIRTMGFKHTGVFPEQAVNWEWTSALIKKRIDQTSSAPKILNLFAYTGGATIAAAAAGAFVCHVDASKGMNIIAKTNADNSNIRSNSIRYIIDDCKKFIEREIRRGSNYDAIIMDPPSYGRGPTGQVWKLEDDIFELLTLTVKLMSNTPLFFLLNSYTTGLSSGAMSCLAHLALKDKNSKITADEIGLPITSKGIVLPCGSSVRAEFS